MLLRVKPINYSVVIHHDINNLGLSIIVEHMDYRRDMELCSGRMFGLLGIILE